MFPLAVLGWYQWTRFHWLGYHLSVGGVTARKVDRRSLNVCCVFHVSNSQVFLFFCIDFVFVFVFLQDILVGLKMILLNTVYLENVDAKTIT